MADYVKRKKDSHQPLRNEGKTLDKEERWKVRNLKESVHMLDYHDFLSSIEIKI